MPEEILVNVTPKEVRVALLDNGALQELHIERKLQQGLLGNIYKGKVLRLLPGIQAAFIDIGLERAGFLHAKDIRLDYENLDIRDLLKPGEEVIVQVYKDPLGSKGARLTKMFSIPSRYLVLTPDNVQVAVSQKITDEAERARLVEMLEPDDTHGYIFRTAAFGANKPDIEVDKTFLLALWPNVIEASKKAKPGEIIYEEIPIVLRVLRDLAGYEIERIRVDQMAAVDQMLDFAKQYVPALIERIEYYSGERPIFDIYSVEDELQKALQRRVYLKSGGYLVFDQTEAMTTIDINTGSYVGHGKVEETIFKTNLEAVDVIARQIRLRNLGGIIIIDFIDMADQLHKDHLLEMFAKELEKDKARTELSELTSLGLLQMTRKRTRESLEHILCVSCPTCKNRGSIKSIETVSYEIFRELKRIAENYKWSGFIVVAAENVVQYLLDEESLMLAELETDLNKPVKFQADSSYNQEQYDILPMSERE